MTKTEVMKKCHFTSDLSREQLEKLANMAEEKVFEVGEDLSKQGRIQEKLYIIVDGLVGMYLELGPMTRRQIQAASNYDVVGWSAMLPPSRSTATATAIETTKALVFSGKELLKLCEANPEIGYRLNRGLASVVANRLHHAYIQLMGVTSSQD